MRGVPDAEHQMLALLVVFQMLAWWVVCQMLALLVVLEMLEDNPMFG